MNWDAIGAIGEIIGAVAVVFSLIYLATQIRISNRASRQAAEQNLLDNQRTWLARIGEKTIQLQLSG
jgi:Zn-dependent membrane protease YugP